MTRTDSATARAGAPREEAPVEGSVALQELIGEVMMFQYGAARRQSLTLLQLMFLRLLEVKGPLSPSQLADRFGISRPSITSSINTLESGGWVVRSHPEGNRRSLVTSLTPRSRKILERVASERQKFLEEGLARLDPGDRERFARVTQELATSLRALRPADDPASRSS
ncbi:MAG: MarR family transcriptional regulator [Thermoplasmata archaeon]|nr:MarR family transcriptional regulator [Thermoplasmata archaeon]